MVLRNFRTRSKCVPATPTDYSAKLTIAAASTSVVVKDSETLIDPYRTGDINRLGSDDIENRVEFPAGSLAAGPRQFATGLALRR